MEREASVRTKTKNNKYTKVDLFTRFMDALPPPKNTSHAKNDYRVLVAIFLQLPLLIPMALMDRVKYAREARLRRRGVRPKQTKRS